MVRKLLLMPIGAFLFTFNTQAQDISGTWSWNSEEGDNMFTVELMQASEDNYRGNHCSVYLEGERIDCNDTRDDFTIILIRKAENIFQGSIRSGYSYAIGNVQLQYLPNEDSMLFSLKTAPEGEYYMPLEARMRRN